MKAMIEDGKGYWIDVDQYDKQLSFAKQKQSESFRYTILDMSEPEPVENKIEKGPKLKLDVQKKGAMTAPFYFLNVNTNPNSSS